jgi:sec-independent protein translocase protein TatB
MFEVGFTEIILILGIALLVLGPARLPKLAADLGRWAGRARAMARTLRTQLEQEVSYDPLQETPKKPSASPTIHTPPPAAAEPASAAPAPTADQPANAGPAPTADQVNRPGTASEESATGAHAVRTDTYADALPRPEKMTDESKPG